MFVALLLALAAETAPAPATAAAPASSATTAKSEDPMVCKTEQVTGSRFPKKVCRLKSEIDQKRADDQARIRDNQRIFSPNTK